MSDKKSLAVAYNIRKKARKPKMMADGGEATPRKEGGKYVDPKAAKEVSQGASESGWQPEQWKKNIKEAFGYAKGGMVEAIMEKRAQKFADGGEVVDLNDDATEAPVGKFLQDQNEEATKKELYDVDQVDGPAEAYNPHGDDDAEMDKYDMIDRIRARLRSIRGR